MTLTRWEPFAELRRLDEAMDRMWREFFRPATFWPRALEAGDLYVPMDVYQTKDHLVVQVTIPGVRPEDVEVTFSGQQLSIHGEIKTGGEVKEEDYLLRERRMGSFTRTISLPDSVDTDKAEASYDHGVLTIRIPKREEVKPKSLKVKVAKTLEGAKAS